MTTPEPPVTTPSQPLPENLPFAVQGQEASSWLQTAPEATGAAIEELPMPNMPEEAVEAAQPPSDEPSPGFWKKLGDKVPSGKVEYSYPSDNRRH
jgi:hypothetical protein